MAKITYTNKVTLNPQPSIADENKVTDDDMNEIKSVVNGLIVNSYSTDDEKTYSCDYINNNFESKSKLLWTNSNPGSVISSDTTITLSSDDYDYILWVMRVSTTNNLSCSNISFKGYGLRTYIGGNYRNITRNNDTSYTINPANSTDFNNALIPIYAIGYKTGLFS